tara:strand:- start:109 stop:327 length:219 start_codon:yes stop_codon:yes gene_type:complete
LLGVELALAQLEVDQINAIIGQLPDGMNEVPLVLFQMLENMPFPVVLLVCCYSLFKGLMSEYQLLKVGKLTD